MSEKTPSFREGMNQTTKLLIFNNFKGITRLIYKLLILGYLNSELRCSNVKIKLYILE